MDVKEIVLIVSAGELRAKLEVTIGKKGGGSPPQKNVAVDKDIGGAFCGEPSVGSSEQFGAPAKAVRKQKNKGVATGRHGEWFELIDIYCDTSAIGERKEVREGNPEKVTGFQLCAADKQYALVTGGDDVFSW